MENIMTYVDKQKAVVDEILDRKHSKEDLLLAGAIILLVGIILGMLIAPKKKVITNYIGEQEDDFAE